MLMFEKTEVPIPKLVHFITTAVDAIVANLAWMKPVLTKAYSNASTLEEALKHPYEIIMASEERPEKLLACFNEIPTCQKTTSSISL